MKVGTGKVDITPPVGVELAGYGPFLKRKSAGVHDNLFCRLIYLEKEKEKGIIAGCDLICFKNNLVKKIRRKISKKFGIEKNKILLAGIHTHSGPATGGHIGWGEEDEDYLSKLPELIVEAVRISKENLKEIKVGIGKIKIDGEKISYNRVKEDVGVNNEIKVMKFVEKETEKPIVLLVNYGAHAVVQGPNNTLISRDWPGKAVDIIREKTQFETIFFQGACGDINSKPAVSKNPEDGFKEIERIGKYFAEVVIEGVDKIETEETNFFRNRSFKVILPNVPISKSELKKVIEENEKILEEEKDERKRNMAKFQIEGAKVQLSLYEKKGSLYHTEIEIQLIEINKALLIAIPAELFVEFQRKIESAFPEKNVFVITYANGSIPYIPSRYDFQVKGYASTFVPRIFGVMPFREDVGDVLVDSIVKFVRE
ncbi:MAG TPA: neutral/alkaline non-lysosomal ceramidase N-terminal domain-containing protein [bacterium]|nr:neutral/alkaline non-lysosomal ceramidase N-terminal domain-containing protein [bacterium]HOM26649.1 neutral/alkaline non-lysosomal ceramidase N-terminal domain-containing protein [bacterium]